MKLVQSFTLIMFLLFTADQLLAQLPPVFDKNLVNEVRTTSLTRNYLTPQRIVWLSDTTGKFVQNAESILKPGIGQADLNLGDYLTLVSDKESQPGIILDFGFEIQGGIEIITTGNNANPSGKVRIRLGESIGEAMSEVGEDGATNDHAMRDFEVLLPWLGRLEVGESGSK